MCIRDREIPVHKLSFILAGSLLVSSGAILAKHEPKAPPEAVSYTHLTLPTSDLV